MKLRGLPQEGLKLIACVTMLLDHIGAAVVYDMYLDACMVGGVDMLGAAMPKDARMLYQLYQLLRAVGRLAFPIYCFLLAEGAVRTRDPKKYGLRLAVVMLLSEIPFDILFYDELTWQHQSVMVTLLLSFVMIRWIQRMPKLWFVAVLVCAGAAKLLNTDYGWWGVVLTAMFAMTREMENRTLIQIVGVALLCWLKSGVAVFLGPLQIPRQFLGTLAMLPIALYSGQKATKSKAIQWMFYLFYPVHMAVLLIVGLI